jgi:membrane associated rhomboid family serine protease
MRIHCLLALLPLSAACFVSVVDGMSPPIARCTPYRKDVSKYVGKAQGRGTTADWKALRGGATTNSRRAAILRRRRKETKEFVLVNTVIYVGLFSAMATCGVVNVVLAVNGFVFCGWQATLLGWEYVEYLLSASLGQKKQSPRYSHPAEVDEKNRVARFMKRHFLQPLPWKRLRASPFSAFGSAFSHIDHGHIAANLSAFATFASVADEALGGMRFAHLYLISSLCSSAFFCFSHERGMTSSHATSGMGASGAISGVISWVCLHTWNRGRSILFSGEEVDPLMLLLLYISGDLSGLFRSKSLWRIYNLLEEEVLGEESVSNAKHDKDDGPKEGVGYAAHIGGMLGGALFFALNCLFEAAMSRYGQFRHGDRSGFR